MVPKQRQGREPVELRRQGPRGPIEAESGCYEINCAMVFASIHLIRLNVHIDVRSSIQMLAVAAQVLTLTTRIRCGECPHMSPAHLRTMCNLQQACSCRVAISSRQVTGYSTGAAGGTTGQPLARDSVRAPRCVASQHTRASAQDAQQPEPASGQECGAEMHTRARGRFIITTRLPPASEPTVTGSVSIASGRPKP